jgi:hypothetical protein
VLEAAGLVPSGRTRPVADNLEARVLGELVVGRAAEEVAGVLGTGLLEALAVLAGLELRGRVVRLPGRRYIAVSP